jgi:hypothetical protein
MEIGDKSDLRI